MSSRYIRAGAIAAAVATALLAGCTRSSGVSPPTIGSPDGAGGPARPQSFAGRDGQIAFIQTPPGTNGTDVYVMNPDGSHQRQLTKVSAIGDFVEFPHWSADGKHIVFTRFSQADQAYELWLMNADGSNQHLLFMPTVFLGPFRVAVGGNFSPDGTHVVFQYCTDSGCTIDRINTSDGGGLTRFTSPNPIGETHDVHPAYSPDGQKIAFTGYFRGGFLERLYVMNADGSAMHAITEPQLGPNGADWSPDGQRIAFWSYEHQNGFGANEEIWTTDPSGGNVIQLTQNNDDHRLPYAQAPPDGLPSYAPAGDAIVFERDSGDHSTSAIYIMGPNGQSATLLTTVNVRSLSAKNAVLRRSLRARHALGALLAELQCGGAQPAWGSAPPVH